MKYLLLIYTSEAEYASMTQEQQQANWAEYMTFNQEVQSRGLMKSGEALMPTAMATTVKMRDGATLKIDGPFAETKEQLMGYYVLDCKDLDEAIEMAAKVPDVKWGSVEIRPVADVGQ
jgi:hypothetical protein